MLNNDSGYKIVLILILIFQLITVFFFAFQKQGYMIDEIASYRLANTYFYKKYSPDSELYNKWTKSAYFSQYVNVQEKYTFSYDSVFFNQKKDVHPPFYYLILHTICSFFPETFSKWFGLSINIVFFIICNIFLFLISIKVFENKYVALLPIIIWGFSAGAISTVLFIRMYMMLTALIVLFVYCHFLMLEKEHSCKTLISFFIITLFGFMTHYYFLFFAFIVAYLYFLYCLIKNKWKELFLYTIIFLGALFTGYLIFPDSIIHIFSSYRGADAIAGMFNIVDLQYRITLMLTALSKQQFGGYLKETILIITIIFLFVQIYIFISKILSKSQDEKSISLAQKIRTMFQFKNIFSVEDILLFPLVIAVTATFMVVAKVSPYRTNRYIYFLYPLISLFAVYFIHRVFSLFIKKNQILISGILLLSVFPTIASYNHGGVEYIYKDQELFLSTAQAYGDYDCIYITNRAWTLKSNIFQLSEFQKTYVLSVENVAGLPGILKDAPNEKEVILYIDKIENQEELLEMVLENHLFNSYKLLYSTSYALTYLIE